MDKRLERQLEEVLKLPGNGRCADCRAPAPRWASVNLGIFLCVGCASIHRKLGTHRSRVKSVTLDTWSREQVTHIRSIGNTAANAVWNPNESLHPPPTSTVHDERDSEIERYIRKKYELGAFRAGSGSKAGAKSVEPTSLNRARERDGRLPAGSATSGAAAAAVGRENQRNPELNDIVSRRDAGSKERDLPPLPRGAAGPASGGPSAPPRPRPTRSPSNNNIASAGPVWNTPSKPKTTPAPAPAAAAPTISNNAGRNVREANLIDFSDTTQNNATLPLQINMGGAQRPANSAFAGTGGSTAGSYSAGMAGPSSFTQQSQGQYLSPQMQPGSWNGTPAFSTSPAFSPSAYLATSPQQQQYGVSPNPSLYAGQMHLSPQPTFQQLSPQQVYGQHLSPQQPFAAGGQMSPQPTFQSLSQSQSQSPSPSFVQQSSFAQQPQQQQAYQQQPLQQQQQQQQYAAGGVGGMGQAYQNPVMSGSYQQAGYAAGGYGYGQQWSG